MRLWRWWVDRVHRPVDSTPFAWVRILTASALLGDLLRVAQLGMVRTLFVTGEHGGLGAFQDDTFVLDRVLGSQAGLVAYGTTLVCMALTAVGVAVRPAIVVGVLAYAQLGHCFPPGDRAIDRVLRCVLLLLLFTNAHRRLSLGNLLRRLPPLRTTARWAEDLLRWFLVLVYLSAGIAKLMQQPRWLASDGTPVVYRVMTDPLAGQLDAAFWWDHPLLFRVAGWGTIALELGAVLLLTRLAPWWATLGLLMHLGIFFTMKLGMLSWGMLAVYPVLLWPWIQKLMDRRRGA